MNQHLIPLIALWLAAANLTAFSLMLLDKRRARRGGWRISERALLLPAILGGAAGGLAGMRWFHHKTRHGVFRYGLPLLAAMQSGLLVWAVYGLLLTLS